VFSLVDEDLATKVHRQRVDKNRRLPYDPPFKLSEPVMSPLML